jgi:hypothetical protein
MRDGAKTKLSICIYTGATRGTTNYLPVEKYLKSGRESQKEDGLREDEEGIEIAYLTGSTFAAVYPGDAKG